MTWSTYNWTLPIQGQHDINIDGFDDYFVGFNAYSADQFGAGAVLVYEGSQE